MKYFFFDCDYNLRTWNFVTLKLQICRKKVPGKKGFVSIFFDSVLFLEWAVKRIAWVLSFSQQLVKKCIHSAIKNRSWHLLGMVIWSPCSNNTCSLCISEVFIYNLCVRLTAGGQTAYHQGPAMVRDSGAKASTVNVSGPGKGLTMKPRLMDSSTTLLVELSLVVWITLSPPPYYETVFFPITIQQRLTRGLARLTRTFCYQGWGVVYAKPPSLKFHCWSTPWRSSFPPQIPPKNVCPENVRQNLCAHASSMPLQMFSGIRLYVRFFSLTWFRCFWSSATNLASRLSPNANRWACGHCKPW